MDIILIELQRFFNLQNIFRITKTYFFNLFDKIMNLGTFNLIAAIIILGLIRGTTYYVFQYSTCPRFIRFLINSILNILIVIIGVIFLLKIM